MDAKSHISTAEQLNELKQNIENLVSDVQDVRLANELSKLTQVRLVDLQYSAKLVLEQLKEHLDEEQDSEKTAPDLMRSA